MKSFLVLLTFLFASNAKADWYVCENVGKTRSVNFGHDRYKVIFNNLDFYWDKSQAQHYDPLTDQMEGGSYNLNKTVDQIILRYIQDTAKRLIGLPSGEIVDDKDHVWYDMYDGKHEFIDVYHGVFPVVNEIVFHLNSPKLILSYFYDFAPRKVSKIRWTFDTEPRMGKEESIDGKNKIFKKREKSVVSFPDCKKEGGIKGFFRYISSILPFP